MSIDFFLTSIIVILLPGAGVLYTLSVGLGHGFKASISAAFGCTLGILPAAIASIIGLAALLHTSAMAFQFIKYLGVAYLFYMAWSILKSGGELEVTAHKTQRSTFKTILNGLLLNVLNPKLSLFFTAFLPQFIPQNTQGATMMLIVMAGVFMALTFVVFVGYGACAALAREHIISRPGAILWLKRSFAGTFGLLGLKLALTDR